MKRYYKLSKKISEEALKKIVDEINDIDGVKNVKTTKDGKYISLLLVSEDMYTPVMNKAVNIIKRLGNDAEVSLDIDKSIEMSH